MVPANGSRLSCGRKAVELQKQRLAGEGTQFFPQEQALVRQRPLRSTDRQDLDDGADHADTVVIVATQQVSLHLQTVAAELLGEIQREVMYTRTRFEGPASALKVEKPNGRIYNGVRVRLERVGRSRAGAGTCECAYHSESERAVGHPTERYPRMLVWVTCPGAA